VISDWQPASVIATDLIDWLADDLRALAQFELGPAEDVLARVPLMDRVMLVEVLEHLEAPWTVLRLAAERVAPGGRLVVTTPNIASIRNASRLLALGHLTSFPPDHPPHMTPVVSHVAQNVMRAAGLSVEVDYAEVDLIPKTGGRRWPEGLARRFPRLANYSLVITGIRPDGP
jgi:2-polyprenyl-3-methyl-5-hydroxy-6-metoxy-1,4-benzoquinol methylase